MDTIDLFGFQIPAIALWILGIIFVVLIVVLILKGLIEELRKK